MRNKWIQLTILILAVVLVVGGGGYWWVNWKDSHISETDVDLLNWKEFTNEQYGYKIKYPPSWKLESSNSKQVKISRSGSENNSSASIIVEIKEKQPEVDLLKWIESNVGPLPPDREFVEVSGGSGWRFIGNAGMNITWINFLTKENEMDNMVYSVTCTAKNVINNSQIKNECKKIMNLVNLSKFD